jgi:hypothetical protein
LLKFLGAILGIFIGAFIGALIEGVGSWAKMVTAGVFGGLALVTLLIMGIWKGCMMLWPGRDKWYATCSYPILTIENDPQRALDKDRRKQWRSSEPQESGAWFKVDMAKPRYIAQINLEADDNDVERPNRWQIRFYRKNPDDIKEDKIGRGSIFVESNDIPNPIRYFRVSISEAAEDMLESSNYAKQYGTKVFWTISCIQLKEYRFNILGRLFWTHEL